MPQRTLSATLVLALALGPGCASYDRRAGVANLWREESLPQIQQGVTTRAQILEMLGLLLPK